MNLCGECNVCCVVPRIDKSEIFWKDGDKEAGKWCEKLTKGGCSVYKKRPPSCIKYECLYLQLSKKIENFSVAFRPDNIKMMVSTFNDPDIDKFVFTIKELEEGSISFDNANIFLGIIFELSKRQATDGLVTIQPFGKDKRYELKQNISEDK